LARNSSARGLNGRHAVGLQKQRSQSSHDTQICGSELCAEKEPHPRPDGPADLPSNNRYHRWGREANWSAKRIPGEFAAILRHQRPALRCARNKRSVKIFSQIALTAEEPHPRVNERFGAVQVSLGRSGWSDSETLTPLDQVVMEERIVARGATG